LIPEGNDFLDDAGVGDAGSDDDVGGGDVGAVETVAEVSVLLAGCLRDRQGSRTIVDFAHRDCDAC
jgi:hypothetical protein